MKITPIELAGRTLFEAKYLTGFCGSSGCYGAVLERYREKLVILDETQASTPEWVTKTITSKNALAGAANFKSPPLDSASDGKPSFDCSKAKTASARLICSMPELAKLEAALAVPFQERVANLPPAERTALINEQREWINRRNVTCDLKGKDGAPIETLKGSATCVATWLKKRTAELTEATSRGPNNTAKVAAGTDALLPQCKITNDGSDRGEIQWLGECKEGFAHGTGTARWFKDGLLNYEQDYLRTNGLIRFRGEPQLVREVVDANIKVTMADCSPSAGYRAMRVEASPTLALYNRDVVTYILNIRAQTLAWQKCSIGNHYSNVDINVYVSGRDVIHARSYGQVPGPTAPEKTVWQEYRNQIYSERLSYDDGFKRASYNRTLAAQQQAQEEARQRQEEQRRLIALRRQRAAEIRRETRKEFILKYRTDALINEKMLTTNPFVYVGKTVGVHTAFRRMLASDAGLFHWDEIGQTAIVVTGIPSTQFANVQPMVLAVKVIGTKTIKVGGGEVTLPHGEYLGFFGCQDNVCSEFYN